ncbi:fimbria/pilus outer membrane usher protein [Luteimonas sp. SDU101]|uniref:fimbria/pilus outer membrane usher protein n=1 Tax=Luteimonas sp. SDU101 TaxID=3422593 RepID=UPI003EB9ED1C
MVRTALVLALLVALPAQAEETLAVLVVEGKVVDSQPRLLDPAHLVLPTAEWVSHGVAVPKELLARPELVAQELGLAVSFDSTTMEVRVGIPPRLRPGQRLGSRQSLPEELSPAPAGVMVDYDIAAATDGELHAVSVGHTIRTNVAGGVLTTTGQANYREHASYTRGNTAWQKDFLGSGTTVQIGDVALPSNGLNTNSLLGGMRLGTDRALTRFGGGFDIPMIGGLADTRSTAEVFVNEHRRAVGQLAPGPYELSPSLALPGLNNLEVVSRDEFGREHTQSRTFYAHPDLLAPGSLEWGVSSGAVRPSPVEDRYGGWAVAGTTSRGMTSNWTAGLSVQAGEYEGNAGRNATVHNTVSMGSGGLLQAHVSASVSGEGSGYAYRVGYERRTQDWSVSASHTRRSEEYWEIGQLRDSAFEVRSQTNASLAFHPRGSAWRASLGYTGIDFVEDEVRQLSATLSHSKPGRSLSLGVAHDLGTGDNRIYAALRLSGSGPGQSSYTARSAPSTGPELHATYSGRTSLAGREYHYQVAGVASDSWQAFGRVDTTVAGGNLSVEGRKTSHGLLVNSRYANSVWIGEGGVINGQGYSPNASFTVVEVPGQADIQIHGSTNKAPRTNSKGFAVISGLPNLRESHVRLDPLELPVELDLKSSWEKTTPRRRGGSKVVFQASESSLRQYEVRMGEGFAPANATATTDTGEVFNLGERGVLVVSNPAESVVIRRGDWNCERVLPKDGNIVHCQP